MDAQNADLKEQVAKTKQQNLEMTQRIKEMDQQIQKQTKALEQVRHLSAPNISIHGSDGSQESFGATKAPRSESAPTTANDTPNLDTSKYLHAEMLVEHAKYLLKDIEDRSLDPTEPTSQKQYANTLDRLKATIGQIGDILLKQKKDVAPQPSPTASSYSGSQGETKTFDDSQGEWNNHAQSIQKETTVVHFGQIGTPSKSTLRAGS